MLLPEEERLSLQNRLRNLSPQYWSKVHQEDHDYDFVCGDPSCYCVLPANLLASYVFTRQVNRSLRANPRWEDEEGGDFPKGLIFNGPLDVRAGVFIVHSNCQEHPEAYRRREQYMRARGSRRTLFRPWDSSGCPCPCHLLDLALNTKGGTDDEKSLELTKLVA